MKSTGHMDVTDSPGALPRRVLHVLNGAQGGAARTTIALIDGLAELGIQSCAYCHGSPNDPGSRALSDAVDGRVAFGRLAWWNRKVRSPLWRRPFSALKQVVATGAGRRSAHLVAEFATLQGADLIHTNTVLNLEGGRAATQLGLPHVWHVRELIGPGAPFRFWAERWAFRTRVLPRGNVFIANSHAAARRLERFLPSDRIVVVLNGLTDDRLVALSEPTDRSSVVVAMVGDLSARWKRQDVFIRAAAAVRSPDAAFVLYGNAPAPGTDRYSDELRSLADQLGIAERLTFMGRAPDPVTNMDATDVLVHPATDESFGRVIIEAMLAGRPVVGVAAGGVGEIVVDDETGLLVDEPDPLKLAAQIDRLVTDRGFGARLGAAGRERALLTYGADQMVRGVAEAYRRAVHEHRGQSPG